MTSRRYFTLCWWTGLRHYMSFSEGRQLQYRPNKFTFTSTQLIVKVRIAWIVKLFQIRYTPTFQLSCLSAEGHPVLSGSVSVFSSRSIFPWRSRTCFSGSETKSSQTHQITAIHTINRNTCKKIGDSTAARENIQVEHSWPSIRTDTMKQSQARLPKRI